MTVKNKFNAFAFLLAGSIAFSTASFGAKKEIKVTAETSSELDKSGATLQVTFIQSGKMQKFPVIIDIPVNSTTTKELGVITVDDAQPLYFTGESDFGGYISPAKPYVNNDQQKYIDPEKTNHITLKNKVIRSRKDPVTYTYVLK